MKKNSVLMGAVFVVIGALLLIARLFYSSSLFTLRQNDFWPMIILMLGVGFELAFFISMKAPGLLVPGGMLTTYGILFFFEVMTRWKFSAYTWPVYLIGIAVGLFQLYIYTGRRRGLLIATGIIAGMALGMFAIILFRILLGFVDVGLVGAVILIMSGLVLVFGKGRAKTGAW